MPEPTARTALRDRIANALRAGLRQIPGVLAVPRPGDRAEKLADALMPVVEAETAALRQRIEEVEDQRDQALAWQDTAERELRNAERRLDHAERIADALEAERDQSRRERDEQTQRAEEAEARLRQYDTAIATERRGRLAAEAAVRRVRELARNRIAVPTDVLREALTIEQPEETP